MREVPADALDATYKDFVDQSSKAVAVPRGGLPYLRRLTVVAFGEDRARGVFEDGVTSPLARLEAAPPEAVAALLGREPPQLAAAILSRLEPATAALILAGMTRERQAAIVKRVSRLTEVPASTLEEAAAALAAELPPSDGAAAIGIDGMAKAAQILNAGEKDVASEVLTHLEMENPDLSRDLRLSMFTFSDLARLDSRAMRTLLREVPSDRLTTALKGAPEEVLAAVFGGLSQRAADVLRDDMELLPNPRKADLEKARTEIIETALRLEAEGQIDLGR
jgi:flagellar motor switch protein FliG